MPVVIPIIIYTGDKKWKTNGYISEKVEKMLDKKEEEHNMDELIERIKRNDKKKMKEIAKKSMEEGINKVISQGISQGISEGMEKAVINMTKKLKKLNIPLEQIMQVTGLTEERIKSIR